MGVKHRAGFVSNSSTSSYVLVGFEAPEDLERRLLDLTDDRPSWTVLRELGAEWFWGEESGVPDVEGPGYIGFLICKWDQCDGEAPQPEEQTMSLAEAQTRLRDLWDKLGMEGEGDFRVVCGVCAS